MIEDVVAGASRREAAEQYGISPSVVVIWAQRYEETGSVAAKAQVFQAGFHTVSHSAASRIEFTEVHRSSMNMH